MSPVVSWEGRRMADVRDSLGDAALRLACHAAVPVVMDPELLDLMRVNFFLDPPDALPYEVEAELLLSPLFREIGDGLYEMEPGLRSLLLIGLHQRYGADRTRRVAELLEQYADATQAWQALPELEQAQRLTAVSFLSPARAARWLEANESRASSSPRAGLGREWYVAMRRRIGDQPSTASPGDALVKALLMLNSEADAERRLEGIEILGSLAAIPEWSTDAAVVQLCGFIQEQAGPSTRVTPDVQAALSLIGSLPHGDFELSDAVLAGADLAGLDFRGARLTRVTFTGMQAVGINLTGAVFHDVAIDDAVLDGARLDSARLHFRSLRRVSLAGVSDEDAVITADSTEDVTATNRHGTPLVISRTQEAQASAPPIEAGPAEASVLWSGNGSGGTAVVLDFCGLSGDEAEAYVRALLDIDNPIGPDRLDRLLVLDDTTLAKSEHVDAYAQIANTYRVGETLCVLVGPRNGDGGRRLELPGFLCGSSGWPVLWVSRLAGIEWKVERSAVPNRHPGPPPASLRQHPLVQLLQAGEIFDRVRQALTGVPSGVASPGLLLTGAGDEAATFAGALALAIERVCAAGAGTVAAFGELTPARTGGARLREDGPLARSLSRVAEQDREATNALARRGTLRGLVRRGDDDAQRYVPRVGAALADLTGFVAQLLADGRASGGELTYRQREQVRSAGIDFDTGVTAPGASPSVAVAAGHALLFQTVARAVRSADPISLVARRLAATERELVRAGSDKYLPEVENRCPPALLARLASPPQKLPRRSDTRGELGLAEAEAAARALRDLILGVANREWSPFGPTAREVTRVRTAIEGARAALTEYASAAAAPGDTSDAPGGMRGASLARLGQDYLPVLHDLVLNVATAELASLSESGREAFSTAHTRTTGLLREWAGVVQAHGLGAQPPFAASSTAGAPGIIEEDLASVREALLCPPKEEMWQLCAPGDLGALDVTAPVQSVRFASRLARDALISSLPGDEPVWTSSGSFAGLLRLVALQSWAYESSRSETEYRDW